MSIVILQHLHREPTAAAYGLDALCHFAAEDPRCHRLYLTVLDLQFAFNTLSRVSPVSHGVCNVVKRVAIIISSVLFFGTPLSTKTKIGKPSPTWLPALP